MNDNVPDRDPSHNLEALIRTAFEGETEAERTAAAAELLKWGVYTHPTPLDDGDTCLLTGA
jgi:hypothetical protein